MSTLKIIKLQSGAFEHIDSIDGAFFLGRFNFKQEFNKAFLVEAYGAKRRQYSITEVEVFDFGGTAEPFTNWTDLINRLVDLGYTGIDTNSIPSGGGVWGSIIGSISSQTDLQNELNTKLDKVTTVDVEKVYIKNADGTQGMKPVSDFGGGGDFIPLTGTTTGNPVSGDFEIKGEDFNITRFKQHDVVNGFNYFLEFNTDAPAFRLMAESEDGLTYSVVELSAGNLYLTTSEDTIQIQTKDAVNGGIGLTGFQDFTPNITDLDYVQKKYVDTKVPKVTTSGVERAYIINPDGTQSTKPTSDFGGGEENVQSDWNQINILADDFIKNKPELFSGDYNDLINTPALVTNHSELNLDDGTNPHGTTKNDVGLGNADNTSDLGKPISNATQTALNGKANTIHSHVISDVTGLQTALNSKLDKVTTTDVEKVYIKNADGTQGMKPTSEFGGGSVQSVTGDSVDNTDALNPIINAIPLSGTTVGSPVTGDIEFQGAGADLRIFSMGDSDIIKNFITFGDGVFAFGVQNLIDGGGSSIQVNENYIEVIAQNDSVGIKGSEDYSPNITDLDYVQKKYVDTKVPKVTTSGVERAYIINPDGTQSTKPTSDFGTVKGTGTINRISKFTASDTIGDSQIFDDGTKVGIGTTSPQARLDVRAQGVLATDIVLRVRNSTDTQNFLVVNGAGDVYNNGAKGVNTNTFFGENVGRNATGGSNAAIGQNALRANTTGNSNMAIGQSALQNNTTGGSNAAIGVSALQNNTTGASNAAIGTYALRTNTTGNSNMAIGSGALQYNTTGSSNMAIGSGAGKLISDGSNNTITNESIFIGFDTRALNDNETNQIVIGYRAIGLGSNSVVLGNNSITRTQLRGQVIMGAFASPPTGIEGAIYYDYTKKRHYGFDGTNWNALY